jgi:NCAIR mutase (PurE)-related protein
MQEQRHKREGWVEIVFRAGKDTQKVVVSIIIKLIKFNSLLIMCRANSHKANYRTQHSIDKNNYFMNKHNIKSKTIKSKH